MVEITDSERNLSIDEIRRVEAKLDIKLPIQYISFLLSHNGGRPANPKFKFRLPSGGLGESVVNWFLSIYDGEYSNFETFFSMYKEDANRLPVELVPIASDPFGNLVCIGIAGEKEGVVYFWDHENEYDIGQKPGYRNVHFIANTFPEFLNGLESL
jgi:hypothetical protein